MTFASLTVILFFQARSHRRLNMENNLETLWADILVAFEGEKSDELCRWLQTLIAEKYELAELDELTGYWIDEGETWNGMMNDCIEDEPEESMRFCHEDMLTDDNLDIFKKIHDEFCQ